MKEKEVVADGIVAKLVRNALVVQLNSGHTIPRDVIGAGCKQTASAAVSRKRRFSKLVKPAATTVTVAMRRRN
jgi:hypothetical protein